MNRIVQRLLSAGAALTILVSGMGTPVWAIESGSPTSSISDMDSLPEAAANFVKLVEKLPKEAADLLKLQTSTSALLDYVKAVDAAGKSYENVGTVDRELEAVKQAYTQLETARKNSRDALTKQVEDITGKIDSATVFSSDLTALGNTLNAVKEIEANWGTIPEKPDTASLTTAQERLGNLKTAKPVYEEIEKLPEPMTTNVEASREGVDKARENYEKLTEAQKPMVTNYTALTGKEERVSELETAQEEAQKIFEAAEKVSLDSPKIGDKENTKALETLLSQNGERKTDIDGFLSQKEPVYTYDTLTQKVTALLGEIKTLEDQVEQVKTAISSLPEVSGVTLGHKAAIEGAKAQLEALNEEQKALIDQSLQEKLTQVSQKLAELEKAAAELAQAVKETIAAIDAVNPTNLPTITMANEGAIKEARAKYDALADAGKQQVTNLSHLEGAEKVLDVVSQINALPQPESLTLEQEAAVLKARESYNALGADAQKRVDPAMVSKLTAVEAKLTELKSNLTDQQQADRVTALIKALPAVSDLRLTHQAQVEAARAAYNALTAAQKALVTGDTLKLLTDAEAQIQRLLEEQAQAEKPTAGTSDVGYSGSYTSDEKDVVEELIDNTSASGQKFTELADAWTNPDGVQNAVVFLERVITDVRLNSDGKPYRLEFEVSPKYKAGGNTYSIPNSDLSGYVLVRLPIPHDFTSDYGDVYHDGTYMNHYEIHRQGTRSAYIEFRVRSFSTFVIEESSYRPSSSSGSSGGSGSTSNQEAKAEERFWEDVKESIDEAEEGDLVRAMASDATRVPSSVLRTLEGRDVVLELNHNGKTITIWGQDMHRVPNTKVYYTFDELAEIYDGYYDDYEEESSSQSQPETDTSSSRPSTVVNLPAQVPAPTPTPSSSEESSQEEPEEEESSQPEESSSQESSSSYEGFHVQADPEEPADKGGLSAGAVVAIIIGALVLAGGVVALGIYLYKRSNESYYD